MKPRNSSSAQGVPEGWGQLPMCVQGFRVARANGPRRPLCQWHRRSPQRTPAAIRRQADGTPRVRHLDVTHHIEFNRDPRVATGETDASAVPAPPQ